jgi:hypothetical protein
MKKLLLLGIALVAVYMGGRAVKRNAEVLQLLWALIGMTAMASTANTPKTRSVEQRLNTLVPVVFPNTGGTITGNVDVTGNHTVGGQLLVNATGSATMEVGGNSHVTGGMQVDGNHVVGGAITTGGQVLVNTATSGATFAVNGNGHITAGMQVDGAVTTGGQVLVNNASSGATFAVNGNGHITSGLQVDGLMQLSTGSGMPQSAPSTCGSPAGLVTGSALTWANSATSTINSLRSAMISAGVIS